MREQGYLPWIVEYYNSFSRKRVDLYGMFDLIGVSDKGTIAIQTTSTGVAARVKKIRDEEHAVALAGVLAAGWTVQVHGWTSKKVGNRRIYRQRIVEVT